jgi:purine-nucleoside/S-methyl-5'-thioadenosine phosphorylase / adenosine deaminase
VKRSLSPPDPKSDQNLQPIDDLFKIGGLVRNRRNSPAGITTRLRRLRQEAATAEELSTPAPVPDVAENGVGLLKVAAWRHRKRVNEWLWHGFSTRVGGLSRAYATEDAPGELNLGFTAADNREAVAQNRRLLAEAVTGDEQTPIVTLRQFHSNLVIIAGAGDAGRESPRKADGAITAEPGLLIAIQTADCIPVLVADRKRRVVAGFHAGWRGTVKRIVELGVGRMRLQFGSQPEDLIAAIGPGVGQCCYAVGEEVHSEFESQFSYARELFREVFDSDPVRKKYPMLFLTQRAPGHSPIGPALHLDLIEANRRQLLAAGLKASAISVTGGCTGCHTELFFSHRASRGHAGRMMSVIGIRG